jgi:ATP-binding cassette subfamily F protein 3
VPFTWTSASIVPRSLIAECIADGSIDPWLGTDRTRSVLDLCTGNGSLAVLAALAWPEVQVDAADLSADALAIGAPQRRRHGLHDRIALLQGDGLAAVPVPLRPDPVQPALRERAVDGELPAEFRAEPALALAGGADGMDFIRACWQQPPPTWQRAACWCSRSATSAALRGGLPRAWNRLAGHQRRRRRGAAADARGTRMPCGPPDDHRCATSRCDAAPRWCWTAPASPCSPARRSAWSAATAPASPACSRCSPAGCTPMPATWTCRRAGAAAAVAEVAQDMPETDQRATDFVLDGDLPLLAGTRQLAAAEAAHDGHAIAEAPCGIWRKPVRSTPGARPVHAAGPGFPARTARRAGEQLLRRLAHALQLARALMCPADLMLLDEPTNHLDLDALVWLEGLAQAVRRHCCSSSATTASSSTPSPRVTLHLEDASLTRYGGNYTAFEEMRAERMAQQQAAFSRQQDKIAHLQRFIDRFKAKATKARQAQSRVKALARMERLAPVLTASDFEFEFREPQSLPNPMLVMRELACGYPAAPEGGAPTIIVRHVDRTVLAGQRIGILGANGQGKSTLVKTIARVLQPQGGTLTEGKGLAIGYFAQQELDLLSEDDTPLQRMVRLAREMPAADARDSREQALRDFLGQFRFVGDMVHQRVGTLSGGERARLVMATIVWQRPNLLLLDEPTNHLDLSTREALSIALNEFEGTVLLVSHDRALLREVCDEFWLVTSGGVLPFDGDLDDYQRWLLDVSRALSRGATPPPLPGPTTTSDAPAPRAAPPATPGAVTDTTGGRRDDRKQAAQARAAMASRTRPLRIEIQGIDERLERLATERTEIEATLATPGMSGQQIADAGRRLNHIAAETAMLEERWLELQSQIEAMTAVG